MTTITDTFIADLEPKLSALHKERFANLVPDKFSVEHGKRFDRIVSTRQDRDYRTGDIRDGQRMVYAFVEPATGKLIKSASWKAPAKRSNGELQSQYNLSTPEGYAEALEAADLNGAFLYIR